MRQGFVHTILNYVLLHVLFLIYILRGNETVAQEEILAFTYEYPEQVTFYSIHRIIKTYDRILTETSPKQNVFDLEKTVSIKEREEEAPCLSEDISKTCRQYTRLVNELKERVFINNLQFDMFLQEMWQTKKKVEAYAPELLDKNEEENIRNAKILQYHTHDPNRPTKINRLFESICHYYTILNYSQEEFSTDDEAKKTQIQNKLEAYKRILKYNDPAVYMLTEKRLQDLLYELEADSLADLLAQRVFDREKIILLYALDLCDSYKYLLDKFRKLGELEHPKNTHALYRLEKDLSAKVPYFFALYKWKEVGSFQIYTDNRRT